MVVVEDCGVILGYLAPMCFKLLPCAVEPISRFLRFHPHLG
jgi:hypothetical protein